MIAKRVLPTGASGLVGCQAIAPLHRLGDKVHAVGNAATDGGHEALTAQPLG